MTRIHGRGLVLLGLWLGAGCVAREPAMSGEGSPRQEPAAVSDPSPPTGPGAEGGPFELAIDGAAPVSALPPPTGPGHAERIGWSHEPGRFVYCLGSSTECRECRLLSRDGSSESLESGPGCAAGLDPDALEARLRAERVGPGAERWSAGDELVVVAETHELEPSNSGQPRPLLEVGARRRAGGPTGWLLHVDPCQGCGIDQVCTGAAHLDALSLSPDGQEVVALVHLRASDGTQQHRLERIAASRLADAARASSSSDRREGATPPRDP
ncbi:MAG: hypothetical protein H6712_29295 [Myxococcales bacterium]|nr:hypothetical protein [Myxococcales bacterium]MCB9717981.1 hypothetical protein [Myxococcales bacterium]